MPDKVITNPVAWYVLFTVLSFGWGACFGSFLNACIYRIPREISTSNPKRSFCPVCKKTIPWYCNIPMLSYIFLRAKCKYCHTDIPFRYFLIEALTAMLFMLVWFKFDILEGPRLMGLAPITNCFLVPIYWLMIFGLILGTFVDFDFMIIPDRVTLGGIAAGLILSALVPGLHGQTTAVRSLMYSGIGAAAGWGILWLVAVFGKFIFKKDAMGFGDVKLLGAIGAFLGWKAVIFNILVSSMGGSLVGIMLVMLGKREMSSRIPYGPYIALAALLWILWGPIWWDAYIGLMTPAEVILN